MNGDNNSESLIKIYSFDLSLKNPTVLPFTYQEGIFNAYQQLLLISNVKLAYAPCDLYHKTSAAIALKKENVFEITCLRCP